MIPVLVSFRLWGKLSRGCQVVHYIGNESVRLAPSRGSGETSVAKHVAARIMDSEYCLGTKSWYARVSSASNLADDPSRGNFDTLTKLGRTFFRGLEGRACELWSISGDYNGSRSSVPHRWKKAMRLISISSALILFPQFCMCICICIYIGTCYKVRVDIYIYTPFQVDCFNFEHGFVLR